MIVHDLNESIRFPHFKAQLLSFLSSDAITSHNNQPHNRLSADFIRLASKNSPQTCVQTCFLESSMIGGFGFRIMCIDSLRIWHFKNIMFINEVVEITQSSGFYGRIYHHITTPRL